MGLAGGRPQDFTGDKIMISVAAPSQDYSDPPLPELSRDKHTNIIKIPGWAPQLTTHN